MNRMMKYMLKLTFLNPSIEASLIKAENVNTDMKSDEEAEDEEKDELNAVFNGTKDHDDSETDDTDLDGEDCYINSDPH